MTPTQQTAGRHESRRPHHKSRNGCLVCKQRRVKCDERRPRCHRCSVSNRACSYQNPDPTANSTSPATFTDSPTLGAGDLARRRRSETFTAMDLGLLHHAERNLADFMALQGDTTPIITAAIDNAARAPYLVDQLLALSTLHQSTRDATMASVYHQRATELQARAWVVFNEAKEDVSQTNHLTSFLFATLVGIHVFRETLANHRCTLAAFVSAFVAYVRLHRGVRTVSRDYWGQILESDLKPLLYIVEWHRADELTPGTDTAGLRIILESASGSSASSLEGCLSALKWIQWVLDIAKLEPSRLDLALHAIMAWPLLISDDYVDALYQHRPEALVVLSCYAAVLHRYRDFWVFESSGAALFQLVTSHVGPFWADAMAQLRDGFLKD